MKIARVLLITVFLFGLFITPAQAAGGEMGYVVLLKTFNPAMYARLRKKANCIDHANDINVIKYINRMSLFRPYKFIIFIISQHCNHLLQDCIGEVGSPYLTGTSS